jgi:hypothetical protein
MKDVIVVYIVVNQAKEHPVHRHHQQVRRIKNLIIIEDEDDEQHVQNLVNVQVQRNFLLKNLRMIQPMPIFHYHQP